METPSFGNKEPLKSPEQTQQSIVLSEQEKNIQEVFKLNPELQQIASDAINDANFTTLYRIENKNIVNEPNGITSHADLKGQWFSPDVKTAIGYLRKSQKEKGAKLILVHVSKDQMETFHVSKNPIAFKMDVEGDNYVIPEVVKRTYIDLDDTEKVTGRIETIHKATEEVQSKLKELEIKEAVTLYSEYLKTIFPESKVQDIVWHGTTGDWYKSEPFSKERITSSTKNVTNTLGFYFVPDIKIANLFRKGAIFNMQQGIVYPENTSSFPVVINLKTPMYISAEEFKAAAEKNEIPEQIKNKPGDGIIIEKFRRETKVVVPEFVANNYIVYEPEQINILGSKMDIEKFKEFIELKNRS